MKLTQGKRNEIIAVLVSKSFPIEKEIELEKVISDKLMKLESFQTPIMLYRDYPAYVWHSSICRIDDKTVGLNFSYAMTNYGVIKFKTDDLPPDIVEAFYNLMEFRNAKADFKAALGKTLEACSTSKQLIDMVPSTKSFFNERNTATQLVPKELVDKVNGVLEVCKSNEEGE